MSNLAAVESGDYRAALVTLLKTLAVQLDTTESAIHAQLAGQYQAAWDRLVKLDGDAPSEVSPLDEIAARRAAAANRPRAAGD